MQPTRTGPLGLPRVLLWVAPFLAFGLLAFANAMDWQDTRRAHARLVRDADRMISLGVLVSGVAHEIDNPNHFIMSNAGQLQRIRTHVSAVLEEYYGNQGDFMLGGGASTRLGAIAFRS